MTGSSADQGRTRVVITGLGAITPLGLTAEETWRQALAGQSGVGPISSFDTTDCPVKVAGHVKGFIPANTKEARKFGRFTNLAMAAGQMAFQDAGLDRLSVPIPPERMGVHLGVGIGGLPEMEEECTTLNAKGMRRMSPYFVVQMIPNLAAGQLSILLNLKGPNLSLATACASSGHSLGEAARLIQRGEADVMLAGGAESTICRMGIGGFAAMRALSTRPDATASRPWDKDRDGFVMGEGSILMVLERYDLAKARGAKIYAEILGYGASGDAYHVSAPSPEAEGAQRAIRTALADAGLSSEVIDYISAHSTSTPTGDIEEARCIAKVFASSKSKLHVSASKSLTGHLLGAAGAMSALFAVLSLRDGAIPPTANLKNLDPDCAALGVNFTPQTAVQKPVHYSLANSFGFGGTNASLVFGKV